MKRMKKKYRPMNPWDIKSRLFAGDVKIFDDKGNLKKIVDRNGKIKQVLLPRQKED